MPDIARFGVSLERKLLEKFDRHIKGRNYATRSKAIEDLVRETLMEDALLGSGRTVAGTITVVYNHHRRELVNHLLKVQHDCQPLIISTQHIHLNHDHCLEVIVIRGASAAVKKLIDRIKTVKGVIHTAFTIAVNDKDRGAP